MNGQVETTDKLTGDTVSCNNCGTKFTVQGTALRYV